MTSVPKFADSGVFKRLYETCQLDSLSARERKKYEASLSNYHAMLAEKEAENIRIERANERAYAKGRKEGKAKRALDIARNLRALGLATAQIATITGLTEEEIVNIE